MNFETCKKCLGGKIDISASFNKLTGHIILFLKKRKIIKRVVFVIQTANNQRKYIMNC